ncbi:WG repeat-containing protein [Geomonas nitrogeniifigens]|uniref:WG repeat-containing protein n=1 Tax=Geomonas diazotrophica TaxID=2843197 RepID=UPI001C2B82D8|nr:WG repeat-containing protein [Geomonas nitrogeniifigens]QXE87820.1 WG repeat-containing protein [Geomonas nitrogeniifigens]
MSTKMGRLWGIKLDKAPGSYRKFTGSNYVYCNTNNQVCGLIDRRGDWVVAPSKMEIESNSMYDQSSAYAVKVGDKYGAIDSTGNIIVPVVYEKMSIFSNNRAVFTFKGKSGIVNSKGEILVPAAFDLPTFSSTESGLTFFKKKGKYGVIDQRGNIKIAAVYEDAVYTNISDKALPVKFHKKWGVVDSSGKTVIPFKYDDISLTPDGYALVTVNNLKGVIRLDGKWVKKPCKLNFTAQGFAQGLMVIESEGKYGYMDTKGEIIIEPKYDDARPFSGGLSPVQIGALWGIIDLTGKLVSKVIFEYVFDTFEDGVLLVTINGKEQLLNSKLEWVWPKQ